ncbi:MAG: ABC-type transport auxiliary lipoprotein family protein [Pseudomonadota bacterium]
MVRPLVVILALALGGCAAIGLANREPLQILQLTPKSTYTPGLPNLDGMPLQIEVPSAAAGLNTSRIALKPTPTTLEYYAGATWIEVLPVMLQTLVIESFDNTDSVDASDRLTMGGRARFALALHVREFQPEYGGDTTSAPTINIRLQARLLSLPRRDEVARASFETLELATGTSLETIVLSTDDALGATLKDLVLWTIDVMAERSPRV